MKEFYKKIAEKIPKKIGRYWELVLFFLILAIYSWLFFSNLKFYQHQINPDAVSYINIAKSYSVGDFRSAVNGYWGPLISWSMIPFIKIGFSGLLVMKLAAFTWGGIGLIAVWFLSKTLKLTKFWSLVAMAGSVYWIHFFVFFVGTPDIIVVALVLIYTTIILNPDYKKSPILPALAGITGGLFYLAKSYGLYFFLAHFIFYNAYLYISLSHLERKQIIRRFFFGVMVFAIIAGSWSLLISLKYKHLTIGTSGGYNQSLIGPEVLGVHPIFTQGLFPPPNSSATSAWDDPSKYVLPTWSPLKTKANREFEIKIIDKNYTSLIETFSAYSDLFFLAFFLLIAFGFFQRGPKKNHLDQIVFLLVIYLGGYLLTIVEPRYVWPVIFLLLITLIKTLSETFSSAGLLSKPVYSLLLITVVIYMFQWPQVELNKIKDTGSGSYNLYKALVDGGASFSGNIASNSYWPDILYVSYYQGNKFYGIPAPGTTSNKLESDLALYNIDYFWYFGEPKDVPEFLRAKPIVKSISGATIYKLK